MAKNILTDINLNKLEAQNVVIQNLASDPSNAVKGQVYFNTTTNKQRVYNGSTWDEWDSNSGTVTSVAVSNDTNGGLSVSGSPITSSGTIAIGHSNVLTNAQTTSGIYPIKIDKNGHISEYGTALGNVSSTKDGLMPSFSSGNKDTSTTVANTDYVWDATTEKYQKLPSTAFSDTTYTDGTAGYVEKAVKDGSGNTITTTYAPLASPALTGTPTAPTATSGDNSTQIATTAFVTSAISGITGAMVFKGTVGTGGTAGATLPTSGVKVGDTYKVASAGTYASQSAKVGDDTDVTSVSAGAGLNTTSDDSSSDGGTITSTGTLYLTKSGVTAGTYQGLTVDKYGRVTSASNMGYTTNTGTVTKVTAGTGLTGGDITTTGTIALDTSGVTAGTYNSVTVDTYGRVTAGSSLTILGKYATTITGDASKTSFSVTHNLGTRDVIVQVYDATTYDEVVVDVTRTSTSAVTIGFASAPASTSSYKVVVIG